MSDSLQQLSQKEFKDWSTGFKPVDQPIEPARGG